MAHHISMSYAFKSTLDVLSPKVSVGKNRVSFEVGMGYTCNTTHVHNCGQEEK